MSKRWWERKIVKKRVRDVDEVDSFYIRGEDYYDLGRTDTTTVGDLIDFLQGQDRDLTIDFCVGDHSLDLYQSTFREVEKNEHVGDWILRVKPRFMELCDKDQLYKFFSIEKSRSDAYIDELHRLLEQVIGDRPPVQKRTVCQSGLMIDEVCCV